MLSMAKLISKSKEMLGVTKENRKLNILNLAQILLLVSAPIQGLIQIVQKKEGLELYGCRR